MKKILAFLLSLMLVFSAVPSFAEDAAEGLRKAMDFTLPEGMTISTSLSELEVPEDLDYMYNLMNDTESGRTVYYIRPRYGRALVTVCLSNPIEGFTVEDITNSMSKIITCIEMERVSLDYERSTYASAERDGNDIFQMNLILSTEGHSLFADCFLIQTDDYFMEIWWVSPDDGVYAEGSTELEEQNADVEDIVEFFASATFGQKNNSSASGFSAALNAIENLSVEETELVMEVEEYTCPEETLKLLIPANAIVFDSSSTQEEIDVMQEGFIDSQGEGSEAIFAQFIEDVRDEKACVIFTEGYHSVLELFCETSDDYKGMTVAMFVNSASAICRNLEKQYGFCMTLGSNADREISGMQHSECNFWVRSGSSNFQLDVMATTDGQGTLWEVDVFSFPLSSYSAERTELYQLVLSSLEYLTAK